MKTVYVRATRNLDMMNEGVVAKVDRDEQVDRMIKAGHLVEVPAEEAEAGQVADLPAPTITQEPETEDAKPQKAAPRTR